MRLLTAIRALPLVIATAVAVTALTTPARAVPTRCVTGDASCCSGSGLAEFACDRIGHSS